MKPLVNLSAEVKRLKKENAELVVTRSRLLVALGDEARRVAKLEEQLATARAENAALRAELRKKTRAKKTTPSRASTPETT